MVELAVSVSFQMMLTNFSWEFLEYYLIITFHVCIQEPIYVNSDDVEDSDLQARLDKAETRAEKVL